MQQSALARIGWFLGLPKAPHNGYYSMPNRTEKRRAMSVILRQTLPLAPRPTGDGRFREWLK